jgi:hypothetical protein
MTRKSVEAIRVAVVMFGLGAAALTAPVLHLGCSSSDDGCGGSCSGDSDCKNGAKCLSFASDGSDKKCMPASCAGCSTGCKYDDSKCEFDSCQ